MQPSCTALCSTWVLLSLLVVSAAFPAHLATELANQDDQEAIQSRQMAAAARLLAILKQFSFVDRNAFLELLGPERRKALSEVLDRENMDQQVSQKPSRKRSNVMCHFKICNLGRRRRIQNSAAIDLADDQPFESSDMEHV